jgi:hypothetical protein
VRMRMRDLKVGSTVVTSAVHLGSVDVWLFQFSQISSSSGYMDCPKLAGEEGREAGVSDGGYTGSTWPERLVPTLLLCADRFRLNLQNLPTNPNISHRVLTSGDYPVGPVSASSQDQL